MKYHYQNQRFLLLYIAILIPIFFLACHSKDNSSAAISINDGFVAGEEGTEIYYQVIGDSPDTLVVVHGGPGAGMHTVIPMMEPLAEEFTLIFYDQRGGGRSTLPEDTSKLQPHHFVEDMEAVRQHFGLEQMNIITHSFGSVLMAEYALKYPQRIKRMVFHGATGPYRPDMGRLYRTQAAKAPPSPDTSLSNRASELLKTLLDGSAQNPLDTCKEYEEISLQLTVMQDRPTNYRGTTCNAPPEAIRYYYQYTAQLAPQYFGVWDYTTGLEELKAPLLVVYGEKDSLAIPTLQQWVDAVPSGELLLVPDVGKGALTDNPEVTVPAIVKFFKENEY